jgi:hypothetical protein
MGRQIDVETVQSGMILAEPVVNRHGQVLLGAGVALTDRHITVLKTWGLRSVVIEGGDADTEPEVTEAMQHLAEDRLRRRWGWTPRNAIEKEVYELALRHIALFSLKEKG